LRQWHLLQQCNVWVRGSLRIWVYSPHRRLQLREREHGMHASGLHRHQRHRGRDLRWKREL
jgi:hypothetical protein